MRPHKAPDARLRFLFWRTDFVGIAMIVSGLFFLLVNFKLIPVSAFVLPRVLGVLFFVVGLVFLFLSGAGSWMSWFIIPAGELLTCGIVTLVLGLDRIFSLDSAALFAFGLGLSFLALFYSLRSHWWLLIPSGFLIGLAAMLAGVDHVPLVGWHPVVPLFFLGAAFLVIYLYSVQRQRMRWSLLVGFIIVSVSFLYLLGILLARWSILWPVVLLLAGLLIPLWILFIDRRARRPDLMPARLSFLGAAKSVTGSRFLLEADGATVLVDCGLSQERDMQARNWEPFPVPPERIDALLLTHAHLDHCGLIPRLVKEGFRGKIFTSGPTAEIARIVMLDSARLQAEDAENKKARHRREGRVDPHPLQPLYSEKDAETASTLFQPVEFQKSIGVARGIQAEFFDAGHILGSASIRVRFGANGSARTVLFSGDIGRWNRPIINDPAPCDQADYVLMESTYGDSLHGSDAEIGQTLESAVTGAVAAGGNIVIPSFAIERSQEVLYHLNTLLLANRIPHLLVFLDSPMATKVTEIFGHWPDFFDPDMQELIRQNRSPFDLPGLVMARSVEDSKSINRIKGSAIIIAGAGMCTGGRIKHHLVRNISRPESTILFVGYQAQGTLGRQIVEGAAEVRILGETHPVRAKVARISGFSGHADREELLRWASFLTKPPRRAFITHGEPAVAEHFRATLAQRKGWDTFVPSPSQSVVLD